MNWQIKFQRGDCNIFLMESNIFDFLTKEAFPFNYEKINCRYLFQFEKKN